MQECQKLQGFSPCGVSLKGPDHDAVEGGTR